MRLLSYHQQLCTAPKISGIVNREHAKLQSITLPFNRHCCTKHNTFFGLKMFWDTLYYEWVEIITSTVVVTK